MWPTFYIPDGGTYPFVSGEVEYSCGTGSTGTTPVVLPNPANIADGDSQIMIVSFWINETPVWPSTGGWRLIFDGQRVATPVGTVYGLQKQRIYARKFTTGAADFTLSTTASGLVAWAYTSAILKNQNDDDPFFAACWSTNASLATYTEAPAGSAQYLETANQGDLILQISGPDVYYDAGYEPDSEDVEFACTNVVSLAATPRNGHTVAGVYARGSGNNLFAYSDLAPAGWTAANMSRDTTTAFSAVAKSTAYINPTTANGKHYFECEVTLEAGKDYLFTVACFGNNNSGARIWLTYVKPDCKQSRFLYL